MNFLFLSGYYSFQKGGVNIYISPKLIWSVGTIIVGAAVGGICSLLSDEKSQPAEANLNQPDSTSDINNVSEAINDSVGAVDAVVVDAVNANRINQLLQKISIIDRNKAGAEEEIRLLKAEIQKLLTSNRGGVKGIHGFIGETAQVHIANIKAFLNGNEPLYILLDDNSMTDYTRGFQIIQQKACQASGHLGLDAIKMHMDKYPEFVEQGGVYQIPKDMYTRYLKLKRLPEDVAMKLQKEDLRLWKYIQKFSKENPKAVIEPMEVTYRDIQAGSINDTVKHVEKDTKERFDEQYEEARANHAPNYHEFLKVCGISALIEAVTNAGSEIARKLKNGKKLRQFTKQDFKDIGGKFFFGGGKGAFRGAVVYVATNIFKMSAAVISGVVTAFFGILHEGYMYFRKKISREELKKNSIFVVLETAASTFGAYIGKQICKKYPVIGAIAGSIFGSLGMGYFRKAAFA